MTFRMQRRRGAGAAPPSRHRRAVPASAGYAARRAFAALAITVLACAGTNAALAASGSSRSPVAAALSPDGAGPPPAAATAAPAPAHSGERPADLSDVGAWIAYKQESHRAALPDEARLFYRRGVIAHQSGKLQEATRLVRGAAELDPAFVTPHLTLASWSLARDPSQALLRYAVALDLARRSFLVQIEVFANLIFFTAHGLFLGLLAACLIVVFLHQSELRHMWEERLARWLSPGSARLWGWACLLVPFAVGFGLALPAVCFLGLLWPLLRVRERVLFIAMAMALVAAPFAGRALGRLAGPLHEDQAPLYGVASLPDQAWSSRLQTQVARLATQHPENPYLQFGLGWLARQSGDLGVAEAAYRRTLTLWPKDARAMNNLA